MTATTVTPIPADTTVPSIVLDDDTARKSTPWSSMLPDAAITKVETLTVTPAVRQHSRHERPGHSSQSQEPLRRGVRRSKSCHNESHHFGVTAPKVSSNSHHESTTRFDSYNNNNNNNTTHHPPAYPGRTSTSCHSRTDFQHSWSSIHSTEDLYTPTPHNIEVPDDDDNDDINNDRDEFGHDSGYFGAARPGREQRQPQPTVAVETIERPPRRRKRHPFGWSGPTKEDEASGGNANSTATINKKPVNLSSLLDRKGSVRTERTSLVSDLSSVSSSDKKSLSLLFGRKSTKSSVSNDSTNDKDNDEADTLISEEYDDAASGSLASSVVTDDHDRAPNSHDASQRSFSSLFDTASVLTESSLRSITSKLQASFSRLDEYNINNNTFNNNNNSITKVSQSMHTPKGLYKNVLHNDDDDDDEDDDDDDDNNDTHLSHHASHGSFRKLHRTYNYSNYQRSFQESLSKLVFHNNNNNNYCNNSGHDIIYEQDGSSEICGSAHLLERSEVMRWQKLTESNTDDPMTKSTLTTTSPEVSHPDSNPQRPAANVEKVFSLDDLLEPDDWDELGGGGGGTSVAVSTTLSTGPALLATKNSVKVNTKPSLDQTVPALKTASNIHSHNVANVIAADGVAATPEKEGNGLALDTCPFVLDNIMPSKFQMSRSQLLLEEKDGDDGHGSTSKDARQSSKSTIGTTSTKDDRTRSKSMDGSNQIDRKSTGRGNAGKERPRRAPLRSSSLIQSRKNEPINNGPIVAPPTQLKRSSSDVVTRPVKSGASTSLLPPPLRLKTRAVLLAPHPYHGELVTLLNYDAETTTYQVSLLGREARQRVKSRLLQQKKKAAKENGNHAGQTKMNASSSSIAIDRKTATSNNEKRMNQLHSSMSSSRKVPSLSPTRMRVKAQHLRAAPRSALWARVTFGGKSMRLPVSCRVTRSNYGLPNGNTTIKIPTLSVRVRLDRFPGVDRLISVAKVILKNKCQNWNDKNLALKTIQESPSRKLTVKIEDYDAKVAEQVATLLRNNTNIILVDPTKQPSMLKALVEYELLELTEQTIKQSGDKVDLVVYKICFPFEERKNVTKRPETKQNSCVRPRRQHFPEKQPHLHLFSASNAVQVGS